MKVCIIGVGSELLLGQIANTNAQYLSQVLNAAGHHVLEHIVVGDNQERLQSVLKRAMEKYDGIIFTVGLGPTKDDLTKQTVADVLGRELIIDQTALENIKRYFSGQHQVMTPNNKQQALVIEGAQVLNNDVGMAPGMIVENENQKIVLLPGPPKELKPMVNQYMMPHFSHTNETIFSEVLRFAGIGESQLETELIDLITEQSNPTIALLAGTHEVTIRLTANGASLEACQQLIEPVKNEILKRVGQYYYGSNDTTLEARVLAETKQSVALYDGVTEGALNLRLKQVDNQQNVKGYMLHHSTFIDSSKTIENRLRQSAYFVQSLYDSEMAISLLSENNKVYACFLKGNTVRVVYFYVSDQHLQMRERSSNYIMIEWLNWLKNQG